MKYKEVKRHYESGQIECHYFVDENGDRHGEYRSYHWNGSLRWHYFLVNQWRCGEVKDFYYDGTLCDHYLTDSNDNDLATVIQYGEESTHSEEELIEMAKEHGVPLLSELPKTEAELTHWNLKWPECPCLPISTE